MANKTTDGNCFVCGETLGKVKMKNHIMKEHTPDALEEPCYLIKVEGRHNNNYWLFIEVSKTATFSNLDGFMRDIWLECCGHLSAFSNEYNDEIPMIKSIGSVLNVNSKFYHEYDFGSTTETMYTVVKEYTRPKTKEQVRLLARNVPIELKCSECRQPASFICQECMYDCENPCFCDTCIGSHECDENMYIVITNSPRCGECAYCNEDERYIFNPDKLGAF